MVKRVVGTGLTGFVLAGLTWLALPGIAHADESTVVDGECQATVLDTGGEPLTLAPGGLLGQSDAIKVRVGSGDGEESTVSVPVDSVAGGATDLDESGLVEAAGEQACGLVDTTASAANEVSGTTNRVLGTGDQDTPDDEEPPEEPSEEPPAQPEPQPQPDPPFDTESAPADNETGAAMAVPASYELVAMQSGGPLPRFEVPQMPDLEQPKGPGLEKAEPVAPKKNAGRAHALPVSQQDDPPRQPLVFAVVVLAAVAAVLVRRWITRSAG